MAPLFESLPLLTPETSTVLTEADAFPALMGIDAEVLVYFKHDYTRGQTIIASRALFYNPDGTYAASATLQAGLVQAEYPTLALNLTELAYKYQQATGVPVTIHSFKACLYEAYNEEIFWDSLSNPIFTNVTINSSTITVDGDPSDWDPSITLLTLDDADTANFTVGDANFTAIYIATDNSSLFLRLDLESPAIQYQYYDPIDRLVEDERYLNIDLDTDNDGTVDYVLKMYTYGIIINSTYYAAGGPVYNVSWYGTSTPEFAINLSYIGLVNWTAGNNLSITIGGLGLRVIDDYVWNYQAYSTPYLIYVIGLGGETGSSVLVYPLSIGSYTIYFENVEFEVDLSLATYLYLGNFTSDPIGIDFFTPQNYVPFTSFYFFAFDSSAAVIWPINITITYDDSVLRSLGLNESMIKAFYYDKNTRAYNEIPGYTVDTAGNRVTITMTQDLYMAGDPVIVLGAPPLVVGGELVHPGQANLPLSLGVALLVSSVALASYYYRRHRSRSRPQGVPGDLRP